jgi:uncharacterized protein with von Willebrand factor type A (vWA) domain
MMFLSADDLQAIHEQANSEGKALPDALQLFVEHMTNRTDNQIEQAQERVLEFLRERQSSQKSSNNLKSAYGKWPGEETDEQIDAALEELS